jgi:chitinase
VIVLAFVYIFPEQGNGFPGTDFGNQCGTAVFPGPGYNGDINSSRDQLKASCAALTSQIPVCQRTYGKKILLSLGGGSNTYKLTGATDGVAFANLLWAMFGPRPINSTLPRPFDGDGREVQVDGFDLDIEYPSSGKSSTFNGTEHN